MLITILQIIWTVLSMVIFIGIAIWAWSKRRQTDFNAAAMTPLQDDVIDGKNNNG